MDTSPSNPAAGDPTSLGCFIFIFRFNFHQKIIPRVRTTSDLLDLQLALAGERRPVVSDFHSMSLCSLSVFVLKYIWQCEIREGLLTAGSNEESE